MCIFVCEAGRGRHLLIMLEETRRGCLVLQSWIYRRLWAARHVAGNWTPAEAVCFSWPPSHPFSPEDGQIALARYQNQANFLAMLRCCTHSCTNTTPWFVFVWWGRWQQCIWNIGHPTNPKITTYDQSEASLAGAERKPTWVLSPWFGRFGGPADTDCRADFFHLSSL